MTKKTRSKTGGDKGKKPGPPSIYNRKARHDYHILESMEVGISLIGEEVKSIRAGKISLRESFARIIKEEVWLMGCHITQYENRNTFRPYDPFRNRKLLLHKKQIDKLAVATQQKGLSLIPLKIYFKRGLAKLELGVGKGKKLYDKREDLKEKAMKREVDQAMKK